MYNFKIKSVRLVSSAKEVQEGMRMGPVVEDLEQKSSEKTFSVCAHQKEDFLLNQE